MALFGIPLSGVEQATSNTLGSILRGTGPTAATRQMQRGLKQGTDNAMAIAASDRNNPALAQRNAQLANAKLTSQTNEAAGQLRAQETQNAIGAGIAQGGANSQGWMNQLGAIGQGIVGSIDGSGTDGARAALGMAAKPAVGSSTNALSAIANATKPGAAPQTESNVDQYGRPQRKVTQEMMPGARPPGIDWSIPDNVPDYAAPQVEPAPPAPTQMASAPIPSQYQLQEPALGSGAFGAPSFRGPGNGGVPHQFTRDASLGAPGVPTSPTVQGPSLRRPESNQAQVSVPEFAPPSAPMRPGTLAMNPAGQQASYAQGEQPILTGQTPDSMTFQYPEQMQATAQRPVAGGTYGRIAQMQGMTPQGSGQQGPSSPSFAGYPAPNPGNMDIDLQALLALIGGR